MSESDLVKSVDSSTEDPVAGLIKTFSGTSPTLVPSLAAFAGGIGMILDDYKDFAKFDSLDHPSPFHHWLWGALLMIGGVAGLGVSLLNLLATNPKAAEELREKIQEAQMAKKALPQEALEKILKEQIF